MSTVTNSEALTNIKSLQNELAKILNDLNGGKHNTLTQISDKIGVITVQSGGLATIIETHTQYLNDTKRRISVAKSEIETINLQIKSTVTEIDKLIETTNRYIDAFKIVLK